MSGSKTPIKTPVPTRATPVRIFRLREAARLAARDLGEAHATLTTTQESVAVGQASDADLEAAHRAVAEARAKNDSARAASVRAHYRWAEHRPAQSVRGLADHEGTYDGGDR